MVRDSHRNSGIANHESPITNARGVWLRAALLVIAGFGVYWNTLPAPFVFDDEHAIVINEQIRHLSTSLSPTEQGSPLAGRPLVSVSFAINYALGGLNVRGYRLVNIALHVICALLLFAIAARTFQVRDPASRTQRVRAAVMGVVTVVICVLFIREARARNVFDLHRLEARYERAGVYVAGRLPPNALVITSWESGSVRFYGGRKTLVWDALDPVWLDRAIAYSRRRGFEPYLLLERWEEPIFRQRFAGSAIGALDWPPAAEIAGQVRIYRPDDRARYLRGEATPTEYAR